MVVEALLTSDPPLVKEACICMQGWFRDVKDHLPPPARVTIEYITAERFELYQRFPILGRSIPVALTRFPVDDSVPE